MEGHATSFAVPLSPPLPYHTLLYTTRIDILCFSEIEEEGAGEKEYLEKRFSRENGGSEEN